METNNKIALVELPPIIYEGLLSVLKKHDSKLNFLRFSDYNELLSYSELSEISAVFLSSEMDKQKIRLIKKIKKEHAGIKLIGLALSSPHRDFFEQLNEVLYISDTPEIIYKSINKILVTNKVSSEPENILSDREVDVLKLLVGGKQNKEIADDLFISVHTVITHRKNITQKLGVKSTAAMAIYAVSHGIIDLNESMEAIK